MAANTETKIWLAIKSRINTLLQAYQKSYPSEVFTIPATGNPAMPAPFLRVGRINSLPVRMVIDDGFSHERSGFIVITLVYPLGQAAEVYDQIAGSIAEHFKDGTKMHYAGICVSVMSYPHIVEGYEDSGYWNIPVRISWRCYA